MGGAIRADHAGTVDGKQHIQVLGCHVVHELVIGALQEGGVDRHHRLGALGGHAGCQGHGMLLGNGDIEIAARIFLGKTHQTRALAHGRGDAHQQRLGGGGIAQPVAEDIGVGRFFRCGLGRQALGRIKRPHGVVADLVAFSRLVALALGGHDVQQLRALGVLQALERGQQQGQVVTIDRAGVMETHLLKRGGGHEHAFPLFFPAFDKAGRGAAALVTEDLLAALAQRIEGAAGGGAAEHLGQPADGFGDGHVVVVEDDQHIGLLIHAAGMGQRLEGHPGSHRAIADHRHRLAAVATGLVGNGHAQRGGDRGGGMTDAKGVVFTFLALRERCHAVLLLDGVDAVAAAGEDLVRIGLVADIPHQLVHRGVVQVVQRHGQFDHAQAGSKMATTPAYRFDQVGPQFFGHANQLVFSEAAQVMGRLDARKARIAGRIDHLSAGSISTAIVTVAAGSSKQSIMNAVFAAVGCCAAQPLWRLLRGSWVARKAIWSARICRLDRIMCSTQLGL